MAVRDVLEALQQLIGQKRYDSQKYTRAGQALGQGLGDLGRGFTGYAEGRDKQADAAKFDDWLNAPPGTPVPQFANPMYYQQAMSLMQHRDTDANAKRGLDLQGQSIGDLAAYRTASLGQSADQFGQSMDFNRENVAWPRERAVAADRAYADLVAPQPKVFPAPPQADPRSPLDMLGLNPTTFTSPLQTPDQDTRMLRPTIEEATGRVTGAMPREAVTDALSFLQAAKSDDAAAAARTAALDQSAAQHVDRMAYQYDALEQEGMLAAARLDLSRFVARADIAQAIAKAQATGEVDSNWMVAVSAMEGLPQEWKNAAAMAGPDKGMEILKPFLSEMARAASPSGDREHNIKIAQQIQRIVSPILNDDLGSPEKKDATLKWAMREFQNLGLPVGDMNLGDLGDSLPARTVGGRPAGVKSWADYVSDPADKE